MKLVNTLGMTVDNISDLEKITKCMDLVNSLG